MSIHPEGKSCSDLVRLLVLIDPPAGCAYWIMQDSNMRAYDFFQNRVGRCKVKAA